MLLWAREVLHSGLDSRHARELRSIFCSSNPSGVVVDMGVTATGAALTDVFMGSNWAAMVLNSCVLVYNGVSVPPAARGLSTRSAVLEGDMHASSPCAVGAHDDDRVLRVRTGARGPLGPFATIRAPVPPPALARRRLGPVWRGLPGVCRKGGPDSLLQVPVVVLLNNASTAVPLSSRHLDWEATAAARRGGGVERTWVDEWGVLAAVVVVVVSDGCVKCEGG